jgi:hypothetical protein
MSTVRDLIADAYREIHVVGYEEEMDGPQASLGIRYLYRMLMAWQTTDHLWLAATQTVTLTTAANYTLSPRPVRVHSARLVRSGVETPMEPLTRQEYMALPVKTSTGLPTTFYADMQREPVLYVWPVLATAAGETVKLEVEEEITEPLLRQGDMDVPKEWHKAAVESLAIDLAGPMQRTVSQELAARAIISKAEALASDREGSVYFAGPNA